MESGLNSHLKQRKIDFLLSVSLDFSFISQRKNWWSTIFVLSKVTQQNSTYEGMQKINKFVGKGKDLVILPDGCLEAHPVLREIFYFGGFLPSHENICPYPRGPGK